MSVRRVLLLRHGRTGFNAEGRFQGQTDVPLDETGLGQAKRVADTLAAELEGESVRIVSSDLLRCATTAQPLAERLGVEVTYDPRLREIHAGEWQGRLRAEIAAQWPEQFATWNSGDPEVRIGGGESRYEAGARAAEAIREITSATVEDTLICVSHGGCLRSGVAILLDTVPWPGAALEGLRNAHWAELRPAGEGPWRLNRWNLGHS